MKKIGTGNLTLSGTNTYSGATTINGGTLTVAGSIVSAATVNSGGVLNGTGTVANVSVAGGVLAAGNGTAGTSITVNGTLGFSSGGVYRVFVNPATSSTATVTTANLAGGTVNAQFAAGSYLAKHYTIMSATTRNGVFDGVTTNNLPSGFAASLSYTGGNVFLDLALASVNSGAGLPGNQSNVANAIYTYFNSGGTLPPGFVTLVGSSNPSNTYAQVSGQPGASTAQAGIASVNQFITSVFDAFFNDAGASAPAGQGAASGYAAEKRIAPEVREAYAAVTPRDARPAMSRWSVWGTGYGGGSRVNGDASAGTNTTTTSIYGVAAGASYRATPDTLLGFTLGGAGNNFSLANSLGSGRADVFSAGLYARHTFGAAYLAAALLYSWQDTTTDRTVTVAGTDTLHASFRANALSGRIETGWRYLMPAVTAIPYAAVQATSFFLPAYAETATSGSNQFALSYASQHVTATRSELGARFEKAMPSGNGTALTLRAKAAWAHDWNTNRAATATFQSLPGATFVVNGASPAENSALASVAAELRFGNGWAAIASYEGEYSSTTAVNAGKGTLRYTW